MTEVIPEINIDGMRDGVDFLSPYRDPLRKWEFNRARLTPNFQLSLGSIQQWLKGIPDWQFEGLSKMTDVTELDDHKPITNHYFTFVFHSQFPHFIPTIDQRTRWEKFFNVTPRIVIDLKEVVQKGVRASLYPGSSNSQNHHNFDPILGVFLQSHQSIGPYQQFDNFSGSSVTQYVCQNPEVSIFQCLTLKDQPNRIYDNSRLQVTVFLEEGLGLIKQKATATEEQMTKINQKIDQLKQERTKLEKKPLSAEEAGYKAWLSRLHNHPTLF